MIEKDLIEIYKENMFLFQVENKDLWFSLNNPLDKLYYNRNFVILTAWNPNNKPSSDKENQEANEMLKLDLKDYEIVHSIGKYKDHEEVSYLVYDMPIKEALALGIKYKQYSIFINAEHELSYIECSTKKVLVGKKI